MNVKELRKILKHYPDDMLVILSRDEEGNGFSQLYDVAEGMYMIGDWERVYVLDKDIGTRGYTEEDRAPEGAVQVIVLWP